MTTEVYTNNVLRNRHVVDYIREDLKWLNQADQREGFPRIKVWLSKNSGFRGKGVPEFATKILIKVRGHDVFVESKAKTLMSSINQAGQKIRKRVFRSKKGGRYDRNRLQEK